MAGEGRGWAGSPDEAGAACDEAGAAGSLCARRLPLLPPPKREPKSEGFAGSSGAGSGDTAAVVAGVGEPAVTPYASSMTLSGISSADDELPSL